jgi:CheY-like chemotaxis protein
MNAMFKKLAPITESRTVEPSILLVDDNPAIRQILSLLLEDEGYSVLTAADGNEAIEFAQTTMFDLALLDFNTPVSDHWETLNRLSITNPLLPIILISTRLNQSFPALAAGVGAFLEKPLNFVELFHTIHRLLDEPPESHLARVLEQASLICCAPPIMEQTKNLTG